MELDVKMNGANENTDNRKSIMVPESLKKELENLEQKTMKDAIEFLLNRHNDYLNYSKEMTIALERELIPVGSETKAQFISLKQRLGIDSNERAMNFLLQVYETSSRIDKAIIEEFLMKP